MYKYFLWRLCRCRIYLVCSRFMDKRDINGTSINVEKSTSGARSGTRGGRCVILSNNYLNCIFWFFYASLPAENVSCHCLKMLFKNNCKMTLLYLLMSAFDYVQCTTYFQLYFTFEKSCLTIKVLIIFQIKLQLKNYRKDL